MKNQIDVLTSTTVVASKFIKLDSLQKCQNPKIGDFLRMYFLKIIFNKIQMKLPIRGCPNAKLKRKLRVNTSGT